MAAGAVFVGYRSGNSSAADYRVQAASASAARSSAVAARDAAVAERDAVTSERDAEKAARQRAEQALSEIQEVQEEQARADEQVPNLRLVADNRFGSVSFIEGNAEYLTVDLDEYDFLGMSSLPDFLDDLGFSPAVIERIYQTRALDGTQTAIGKNCNVSWTYHPDDGLQMVFEAVRTA